MKTYNPFFCNWWDAESVKSYAKSLGKGMTVYKRPDRKNYNITHTSRREIWSGYEVLLQT